MFDSGRETSKDDSPNLRRRAFLASAAAAIGGLALWQWRRPTTLQAASAPGEPEEVTVVLFSDAGERLKQVRIAKVLKSEEEWRKQLSGNAFDITRHADTEIAYSGKYWNLHDKGIYRCICCDNALFDSDTKFESGTGWPSFWQPIAKENVTEIRTQLSAWYAQPWPVRECDAHLGHVFDDGPQPDGSALLHELGVAAVRETRLIHDIWLACGRHVKPTYNLHMPSPMPIFRELTASEKIFNRVFGVLVGLGLGFSYNYLLQVRGRKSGKLYSTPIDLLEQNGKRYLVAPRGRTQWVRNAEAAGEIILKRGSNRQKYRLLPIPARQKPTILKAYLDTFKREVQTYFPVPAGSPAEAFSELTSSYPAFELEMI